MTSPYGLEDGDACGDNLVRRYANQEQHVLVTTRQPADTRYGVRTLQCPHGISYYVHPGTAADVRLQRLGVG